MYHKLLIVLAILAGLLFLSPTSSFAGQNQLTLTWTDNATNETGQKLERCQGVGCTNFTQLTSSIPANVTTFVDAGLLDSTTYGYRLRAFNLGGDSAYSNIAYGTTNPPLPPNPQSGLTAK